MLQHDRATQLHLLVSDSSRELCRVAMPLASVANLEHLFPDEDLEAVKALGLNFPHIIEKAQQSGLVPQTLIDTQTPTRSYRIWIE